MCVCVCGVCYCALFSYIVVLQRMSMLLKVLYSAPVYGLCTLASGQPSVVAVYI